MGSVLGVGLSAALELARRRSQDDGLANVSYQLADAQVHPFPPAHFDRCISRFGAMFFADPAAAIRQALAGATAPPTPPAGGQHPFSLAIRPSPRTSWPRPASPRSASPTCTSPSTTAGTAPPPTTSSSACGTHQGAARDLDAAATGQALPRLRATLAAHDTGGGVLFDSRAWIITATLPGRAS